MELVDFILHCNEYIGQFINDYGNFIYAILFLIFDIETIFLYPFAIFTNTLGWFAIVEAFVFVLILLFGLIFAINKKMLRWL